MPIRSVRSTPKRNNHALTAIMQVLVRATVNAHYDPRTISAFKRWQRSLGVTEDGLIGPTCIRVYLEGQGAQRLGSTGSAVQIIQYIVGVRADGKFGPVTDKAVRQAQHEAGIKDDGVFGPESIKHLVV